MPSTFPTHPVAVLPLKLWRPRWFDGVALVLGSMAPDAAYVLDGSGLPVWPFSHEPLGLVGWCLPLTLIGTRLVRSATPTIVVHLPNGGSFALRDYGAIRAARHRWWITALSALIGAASHIVLDTVEQHVPMAEYVFHAVGIAAIIVVGLHIGRRRLVRHWYGTPPAVSARPRTFWMVAGAVALPAAAVTPFLPAAFLPHTTGARLLAAIAAGLLAGAAAVAVNRPERTASR
ncbi:hypothetical protein Vau01_002280 [Virgisporangium aurantiacum]|uniref:DUF4184 family protein n=1 Tax=Virgisporangium aurantiacum TaxID=175570 RepID=A0A8J3YXX4_9ACTN|nr:hypothetical protein Vau01_002280 [Virgisporangium aurantiacum]